MVVLKEGAVSYERGTPVGAFVDIAREDENGGVCAAQEGRLDLAAEGITHYHFSQPLPLQSPITTSPVAGITVTFCRWGRVNRALFGSSTGQTGVESGPWGAPSEAAPCPPRTGEASRV